MKKLTMSSTLIPSLTLGIIAWMGAAQAATVTVNVVDTGLNAGTPGTFFWALTNCNPGDTIAFNIAGAGPHYLKPPAGGFPLIYQKHNLVIDGYTQPGAAVNTAAITATNNAVIKIVLDGRDGADNGNFTDMAYVFFGTKTTPVPAINNTALYGDGTSTATGRQRGGYDPDTIDPYVRGEVALLGIYRSTNVTIKGLALVGKTMAGGAYLMAVAQDFGYDTTVRDRFAYFDGTSRGFHVAGCWFGIDPGTGADAGAEAALAMFRHRDRPQLAPQDRRPSVTTDPDDEGVPNGEGASIGVGPSATTPRAEFNVFGADFGIAIGAEMARTRISGNQFFSPTDIGRYSDTASPSMVVGTDGDGVNDAEEGNLFLAALEFYNTQTKAYVIAGNVFNLARDGSRPNMGVAPATVAGLRLDQGTGVRFGTDGNGVSDALEKNRVFDAGFGVNSAGTANVNASWLSSRRNEIVASVTPLLSSAVWMYFDKFMDATLTPKPAISDGTTVALLKGTCPTNRPPFTRILVDVYLADPEGDLLFDPQGKTWLATYEDNSAGDADPAVGAFSFNISSLALASGTRLTLAATYRNESRPTITSSSLVGTNFSLTVTNGNPPYAVLRATAPAGPWSSIGLTKNWTVTTPASGAQAFYRVTCGPVAEQTGPFADSFALP